MPHLTAREASADLIPSSSTQEQAWCCAAGFPAVRHQTCGHRHLKCVPFRPSQVIPSQAAWPLSVSCVYLRVCLVGRCGAWQSWQSPEDEAALVVFFMSTQLLEHIR